MSISPLSRIRTLVAACAIGLAGGIANASAQVLQPRAEPQTMTLAQMQSVPSSNRVHVKFRESNVIRLKNGQLSGTSSTDADALGNILAQRAIPTAGIRRLFTRPEADLDIERQAGQQRSGRELPGYLQHAPPCPARADGRCVRLSRVHGWSLCSVAQMSSGGTQINVFFEVP
jgi:hypothetical protein